jgi:hypothetical protein
MRRGITPAKAHAGNAGPGVIPVSALHGRPSASADAARIAEIERLRTMTALDRMRLALSLGYAAESLTSAAPEPK